VEQRLEDSLGRTQVTFAQVIERLAAIDQAQKRLDDLAGHVGALSDILVDKRARGALGEVQLEHLLKNLLPPRSYALQHTLSNQTRVDCALFLPPPTGMVCIDAKFPLESYQRQLDASLSPEERQRAGRQLAVDVRKHIDDIASKYLIPGETGEGAILFVPAEAVFAEIHASHRALVEHAMARRVWIASPTTLMAILNTARAVLRDLETRLQVNIIRDNLGQLGVEFQRFDERMKKLAEHIRRANEDAEQVRVTSLKISRRFASIERVELDAPTVEPTEEPPQLGRA
jgi:DNA recombination protein RmuC